MRPATPPYPRGMVLPFVVTPLLTAALMAAVVALVARALASRHATRMQRRMEAHASHVHDATDDADHRVLRGSLVVDGEGCPRPRLWLANAGRKWAVAARWRSHHPGWPDKRDHAQNERAGRLLIDTSEGEVLLDGPVDLVVGSQIWWAGTGISAWWGAGDAGGGDRGTTAQHGDEVVVAGVERAVADAPTEGNTDYRRGAGRRTLRPGPAGEPIRMSVAGDSSLAPRPFWLLRHPVVLASALFGLWPAFAIHRDHEETAKSCQTSCASNGRCFAATRWSTGLRWEAVRTALYGNFFTCVARRDGDCLLSRDCASLGACSLADGVCRATKSADCEQAQGCALLGYCTAMEGRCGVQSDDDCRRASVCRDRGLCSAVDGVCRATRDTDRP